MKERIEALRRAMLRNSYMLERSSDEKKRIDQSKDLLDDRLRHARDQFAKDATRDPLSEEEFRSVLGELGVLPQ